jgi:hypothetical protein
MEVLITFASNLCACYIFNKNAGFPLKSSVQLKMGDNRHARMGWISVSLPKISENFSFRVTYRQ